MRLSKTSRRSLIALFCMAFGAEAFAWPSEFRKACATEAGLRRHRTVSDVDRLIWSPDARYYVGCIQQCQYLILLGIYKSIEVIRPDDKNLPAGLLGEKYERSHKQSKLREGLLQYPNTEPGYYRFWLSRRGDSRCLAFQKAGEHYWAMQFYDRRAELHQTLGVRIGKILAHWCIAREQIEAPSAHYIYVRSSSSQRLTQTITMSKSVTMVRARESGEVLASLTNIHAKQEIWPFKGSIDEGCSQNGADSLDVERVLLPKRGR
jgi:hypothetical protein